MGNWDEAVNDEDTMRRAATNPHWVAVPVERRPTVVNLEAFREAFEKCAVGGTLEMSDEMREELTLRLNVGLIEDALASDVPTPDEREHLIRNRQLLLDRLNALHIEQNELRREAA